ncbi:MULTISPECIES: response regulator transcription factor [Brevibacterium]|uniref:response regulator transcription factor n=1 Tax=Brevibacterium TaxID=1696 RepID=UPI0015555B0E|nr:response regulator transcription factor [Brevibacterium sp. CT2-23B]
MNSADSPIRVMVVDDDAMVITGIRGILQAADDIEVIASAASGEESIEKATLHFPDVVLMDMRMPGMGGIDATERLLNGVRPPKVVALTSMSTDDYLLRALEVGAAGYLLKDIGPLELAEAVRKVHSGEPILAPQAMRQMIAKVTSNPDRNLQREAEQLLAELTERELEVAQLVAEGLSNSQIAQQTFMSLATVKTHLNRINIKLDTDNRVRVATTVVRARGLL